MDKISIQGAALLFEKFKNETLTDDWDFSPGYFTVGLYLSVMIVAKTLQYLPPIMDNLISVIKKVGELSVAFTTMVPQLLTGIRAAIDLFWSLVHAIFVFVIFPVCQTLKTVFQYVKLLIYYIKIFVTYCKNGFKWPEEKISEVPMLEQGPIFTQNVPRDIPRSGRNCYGVGKLNV